MVVSVCIFVAGLDVLGDTIYNKKPSIQQVRKIFCSFNKKVLTNTLWYAIFVVESIPNNKTGGMYLVGGNDGKLIVKARSKSLSCTH